MARDLLADLKAAGDNAMNALAVVGQYRRLLDRVEAEAVETARGMGQSWEAIGDALGMTRQGVWRRYATGSGSPAVVTVRPRPSDLQRRYPGLRRHMALRQAIAEDHRVLISDRRARVVSTLLADEERQASDHALVLEGQDVATGDPSSFATSLKVLRETYLTR